MTFTEVVSEFIESRGSHETKRAYRSTFNRWCKYCEEHGVKVQAPSLTEALGFRMTMDGLAPLTVRWRLSVLCSIYRRAQRKNVASENPFSPEEIDWPKASLYNGTQVALREVVEPLHAELHRRSEKDPFLRRDLAIFVILNVTGMRRVSVVGIPRDGLHSLANGTVVCRHPLKGGGWAESELTKDALVTLKSWLKIAPFSSAMFCDREGKPLTPAAVSSSLGRAAKAVGVHFTPHMARASFITELLDANAPIAAVRAAVHHKSINSTIRYDRGARGSGMVALLEKSRAGGS